MENTLSSSTYSETDVLIVGADPVGLKMACELRRRGILSRIPELLPYSHLLLDQAPE